MTREWMEEFYARHRNDDFRENCVKYYAMFNRHAEKHGGLTVDVWDAADSDM